MYLGTNDQFFAILSPHYDVINGDAPAVFNPELPGFNAILVLGFTGGTGYGLVGPLAPSSPPGTQNLGTIQIPGADFAELVERTTITDKPVRVYARGGSSRSGGFDTRGSHIPGAGEFVKGKDDPFVIYVPRQATSAGCNCSIQLYNGPSIHASALLSVFVAMAFLGRRARRR